MQNFYQENKKKEEQIKELTQLLLLKEFQQEYGLNVENNTLMMKQQKTLKKL